MRFERELVPLYRSLPAAAQVAVSADFLRSRKSRAGAFLAWLCLGSHYRYLGRPKVQTAFWLTAGGLLVWWLLDLFRLGRLVDRANERMARRLIMECLPLFEADWPVEPRHREPPCAGVEEPGPPELQAADAADPLEVEIEPKAVAAPTPEGRKRRSSIPAMIAASGLATAAVLCVLYPAPVYPRAEQGEPFRTLRNVNVRAMATTSGPIRSVVPEGRILRGTVRASADGASWLRIERGPHAGGYVHLKNLEPQS